MMINAERIFYKEISVWSFWMRNPANYGFENSLKNIPESKTIYKKVDLTSEQIKYLTNMINNDGTLQKQLPGLASVPNGIASRIKYSEVSKGFLYFYELECKKCGDRRESTRSKKTPCAKCMSNEITQRRKHKQIKTKKTDKIVEIIKSHPGEKIIIWVLFDTEGDIIESAIKTEKLGSVSQVNSNTSYNDKMSIISDFMHGDLQYLVCKASTLGMGQNFQVSCHVAIISGMDDSYEKFYQLKKRIDRIGQTKTPIHYIVYTNFEEAVLQNVLHKQQKQSKMIEAQEILFRENSVSELQYYFNNKENGNKIMKNSDIQYSPIITDKYQIYHADCIGSLLGLAVKQYPKLIEDKEYKAGNKLINQFLGNYRTNELEPEFADLIVTSPPFIGDIFTYSNDSADMGNTRGAGVIDGLPEAMLLLRFWLTGLKASLKSGRMAVIHVEQPITKKAIEGYSGIFDYRGKVIEMAVSVGWHYWSDIPIIKNQQVQARVRRVPTLGAGAMYRDRTRIAPCRNGYLIVLVKPGESKMPINNKYVCSKCGWVGNHRECYFLVEEEKGDMAYINRKNNNGKEPGDYQNFQAGKTNPWCPVCKEPTLEYEIGFCNWVRMAQGAWDEVENIGNAHKGGAVYKNAHHMGNAKCAQDNYNKNVEMLIEKLKLMSKEELLKEIITELNKNVINPLDMDGNSKLPYDVWASQGVLSHINESDVVKHKKASKNIDLEQEKHLCPLPQALVNEAIKLFSNPGEVVFDPFLGSGTTISEAIKLRRKGVGMELKHQYFRMALKIINDADTESQQTNFLDKII